MYIHSILFCILGSLGLICSLLLFIKRFKEQRTNIIIFWICQKGTGIFHQIFFAVAIFLAVNEETDSFLIKTISIIVLFTLMIIEILFIIQIVKYYQSAESIQDQQPSSTKPTYLTEISITGLLDEPGSPNSITITDPIALATSMTSSNVESANDTQE